MSALSNYVTEDFKPSSLSQRIRALESAGITDKFVKKRIPSYASEAAEIGNEKTQSNRIYQIGESTKIYQNPSNHFPSNAANTSITSSIYSNSDQNNNRIHRSNSVDSIEESYDDTLIINESSNDIVREDSVRSPVNYHHIITELNEAKSRLRKVTDPMISPVVDRKLMGNVLVNTNLNHQYKSPVQKSPTVGDTSFSRATAKLLAESLNKHPHHNYNDSTSSLNQIPISIPLNGSSIPTGLSRSSTPGGIASLINIFHDVNKHTSNQHNTLKANEKSKSLINIFDSQNTSYNSSYNKYANASPRPYQNPIGNISSLKNIAQDVFDHSADDNQSMRSSVSSQQLNNNQHQPVIYSSHRSSFDSRHAMDTKQYVSQYTARTTNLLEKNNSSTSDLIKANHMKTPSFERLDSNDNSSNRPSSTYLAAKKGSSPSLYDEYLNSNQCYRNSVNSHRSNSSSVSTSNTIMDNNEELNSRNVMMNNESSSNSRSHLLIFNSEYTRAMNQNFHTDHFSCHNCDKSLTGCRYILKDEQPHCISCYEQLFANGCEECKAKIGTDSKDLSYKDKHWHEKCFFCHVCKLPLVDKPFGSKNEALYCGECYNQAFASRCDKCAQIFKPGMKKMEYKGQQFHENCFLCSTCNISIGAKSFIPKDNKIFCVPCYEHNFATKCTKCVKVISQGGVTYKNMPFHRECFTCTNCQSSLAGQRFTSRDDHPYCSDCFGKLFAKKCYSCIKPITVNPDNLTPEEAEAGIGGTKYISFEDRHWHNECFSCNQCHASLVGRGFLTDAMDILCPDCGRN